MRIRVHTPASRARTDASREARAQAMRDAGVPERQTAPDCREPFELDLRTWGWRFVRLEPRAGYVSARLTDKLTGELIACAPPKTLFRLIASRMVKNAPAKWFADP